MIEHWLLCSTCHGHQIMKDFLLRSREYFTMEPRKVATEHLAFEMSEKNVQPKNDGLQPKNDGLQPKNNGLQPKNDGIQPKHDGLQPKKDGLQPKSDGL